jgi:hypothetical protein
MKLWKGIEVEGEHQGALTLFVGDPDLTIEEIEKHIDESVMQIYFGAGICTPINEDTLRYFVDNYTHKILSAEIDIKYLHRYSTDILKKIYVIIVITHKNFYNIKYLTKYNTFVKIQSLEDNAKYLAVGNVDKFKETNMDEHKGKTYEGDEIIK